MDLHHHASPTTQPSADLPRRAGLPAGTDALPLGRKSVFELGSITKAFTGILLADVVDRGEVALADPVALYLPDEAAVPSRNGREITLLDLTTHRSGLPRMPDNMVREDDGPRYPEYTIDDLYDWLSSHELRRRPAPPDAPEQLGVVSTEPANHALGAVVEPFLPPPQDLRPIVFPALQLATAPAGIVRRRVVMDVVDLATPGADAAAGEAPLGRRAWQRQNEDQRQLAIVRPGYPVKRIDLVIRPGEAVENHQRLRRQPDPMTDQLPDEIGIHQSTPLELPSDLLRVRAFLGFVLEEFAHRYEQHPVPLRGGSGS